ncbi:hypothetical protein BDE02_07G097700 [Populus trichocarpa]|uniref:NAC domain-containing protein n=1 Tax=Populus trichocarpa TaxID=3694 RepID=B9HES9_POPTR|nr:hypothetical protein BDE02_07G097700 [Populus trichocarpa]|eukprot:XP_002310519.1 NAC domain-containing protein 104 [Populus trichocarpa]
MGDHGCSGNLPPGFVFSPTDEELVLHFLHRKASLLPCNPDIIPDLGLYPHDPWQLEGKALSSGNQWYYFSQVMENQVTENGFWKSLDTEEPIFSSAGKKVGLKKYLVYCIGAEGVETSWMMQEYHLCNSKLSGTSYKRKQKLDCHQWILCRVYEREGSCIQNVGNTTDDDDGTELSCLDEMFLSMDDDLDDISFPN